MADEPTFSPAISLVMLARDVEVRLAGILEPHALTVRKYAVLQRIAATPGVSPADLARGSRSSAEGAAGILRALVAAGFVRSAGSRPEQLSVTTSGSELLTRLDAAIAALDDEVFAARADLAAALARD
jgi:DNA-binding MarR family transcriptional regulator